MGVVTIDILFNYSLVLIAAFGGGFTIGLAVGKNSSKKK